MKKHLSRGNPHSHPKAGENWGVRFETKSKVDLTITRMDQATIDDLDDALLTSEIKIEKEGNSHNTNNGSRPGIKHNVVDNLHNHDVLTSAKSQSRQTNQKNSRNDKGNIIDEINALRVHDFTSLWENLSSDRENFINSDNSTTDATDVKQVLSLLRI